MKTCCVPFCNSTQRGNMKGNEKISFYEFPSKLQSRTAWLNAIFGKVAKCGSLWQPSDHSLVCNKHFTEDDFSRSTPKRRILLPYVVPSIFPNYSPHKLLKSPVKQKISPLPEKLNLKKNCSERLNSEACVALNLYEGKPSKNPEDPDYVPNIFSFNYSEKKSKRGIHKVRRKSLEERDVDITHENLEMKEDLEPGSEVKKCAEKPASNLKQRELPKLTVSTAVRSYHKIPKSSQDEEELYNLKLELNQAYTDISVLTAERNILVKEITEADVNLQKLHDSMSVKDQELLKLKNELQQAHSEIKALNREKEELQKKLTAADITQGILRDPSKLQFYTGLNSVNDFYSILFAPIADTDSNEMSDLKNSS